MSSTTEKSPFSVAQFPYQKRSQTQKGKTFFKQCVEAGVGLSGWGEGLTGSGSGVRATRRNKIINYNLLNNIVDPKEVERAIDPFNLQFQDTPLAYKNYPLINPNLNLLVGEERKRVFQPMFVLTSHDAITEKVKHIEEEFHNFATELLAAGETDEQKLIQKIQEFDRWKTFGYKDKRERMANQVIQYLYHTGNLKEQFSRGFKDLLATAEEIYVIDIIGKEPRLRKGDPINFYTLRGGNSYKIEDNEIIVEDGYLPPGETIDRYKDYLSDADIRKIESGYSYNIGAKGSMFKEQIANEPINIDNIVNQTGIGNILELSKSGAFAFGGSFDMEGNVRVVRVVWRGLRKIGIMEYTDETGNYVKELVPESYEPKTELGEEVDWQWITEWYEGTRIGDNIFVKMQPLQLQVRTLDNLSSSTPGIVGTTFNVGSFKAMSMVDMTRDYQYFYNKIMIRTEHAIAKYIGKVGKLNSAMKPDGWTMEKWLYYLYNMNLLIEDPFNEGQKGIAQGKLAGSMSQTGNQTEIGDAEFIQQHIAILDFIERRVDEITGITPQRKGAVDNRETVGGVERAVMQSSHITEEWFAIHDDTRIRALSVLLEAAKIAWDEKSFTRGFVLDDGTEAILDFDSEKFNETSYGGYFTADSENNNIVQQIRALAQPMIQTGAKISMIVDLYRTKDIGSLHRKIQMYEEEIQQQNEAMQQAAQEAEQAAMEAERELEMMKIDIEQQEGELDRELKQYEVDRNNETKIAVAQINAYRMQEDWDKDGDGTPDPMQIGDQAIKRLDVESKHMEKQQEIRQKKEESDKKAKLEEKKLALEEKKIEAEKKLQEMKDKAAMAREKLKARTALRNPTGAEAARGKTVKSHKV